VTLCDGVECLRHERPPLGIDGDQYPSVGDHDNDIDRCQYAFLMQSIATIAASCPPLLQEPIEAGAAEQLAAALKVIADPARLRLLSLIQAQPGHEACVCHLTEPLGLSQPTVSHHLKVLRGAGLVEREQRGSWAFFRVREERLAALRALLA
jgi:ArsR family transcriptional regulator